MQAHALTRTRYFYNLNVIISHPIENKEEHCRGLPLPPLCLFATVNEVRGYFASTAYLFLYNIRRMKYVASIKLRWDHSNINLFCVDVYIFRRF
jgi:hypothetical protein